MRYSATGRPRRVTDADIAEILAWIDRHETTRELAQRLGLSPETVRRIARSRGQHYKTESPELRAVLRPPVQRRETRKLRDASR
jgi:transposase